MIRRKKRAKSAKLLKIIFLFLGILFILAVFLFIRFNPFIIKQIEIKSDRISCTSTDQLKGALSLYGQNLFLLNKEKLTKSLKEKFICLKDINLSRVFPNKIKIEAIQRQPAAILINLKEKIATSSSLLESIATPSAEESTDSFVVDTEGVVFSKDTGGLNVPKIYISGLNIAVGKPLRDDLTINCLKIIDKVKTFGVENSETLVLDDFFIINSKPKIIFRLNDKIDVQLASLQLILAEAKIDLKELEFIDLRYDKPIVKYTPKKNG